MPTGAQRFELSRSSASSRFCTAASTRRVNRARSQSISLRSIVSPSHEASLPDRTGGDVRTGKTGARVMVWEIRREYSKETKGDDVRTPDDKRTQDFKSRSKRTTCASAVKVYAQATSGRCGLFYRCREGVAREEAASQQRCPHKLGAVVSNGGRLAQRRESSEGPAGNAGGLWHHAARCCEAGAGRRCGTRLDEGVEGFTALKDLAMTEGPDGEFARRILRKIGGEE